MPQFQLYFPDDGEDPSDARLIEGKWVEDAIEKYFEKRGIQEESDLNESIVMVRQDCDGYQWRKFTVRPEATVIYYVEEE